MSCVAPCWSMVPRRRVCVQSVLDGLGCLLSENGSGGWTEGLNRTGLDLSSSNRRSRLNWAARDIQQLPKVLHYEPSGRPPRGLLQTSLWGGSGMALLGGKGPDEGLADALRPRNVAMRNAGSAFTSFPKH